jgi:hypothetical protein
MREWNWRPDAGAVLLVALFSFTINQSPLVFSGQPRSLGADGDSWFHVAIQMALMTPGVFPRDPEVWPFYIGSRPASELVIHRAVVTLARALPSDDLLVANIIGFWIVNLVFLSGCFALGRRVLGSRAGAAIFAGACAGLSPAILAWWGMPFGAVIPHDVGAAAVPWFVLGFLRWGADPRAGLLLFFALGLAANFYPLQPMYLMLIFLGVGVCTERWGAGAVALRAGAFMAGALPIIGMTAVATLERLRTASEAAPAATFLLRRHYPHLFPDSVAGFLFRLGRTPLWLFCGLAALAVLLRRREAPADDRRLAWFAAWAIALSVVGLFVAVPARPAAAFLFHRASALIYVPAYLGSVALAGLLWRRTGAARLLSAAVLLAVALNAGWRVPLAFWLRDERPLQTSEAFHDAASWARANTLPDALFLVPFHGRTTYYAFRVYAQRAVFLHYALGEIVLVDPAAAQRYYRMERDIAPVWRRPALGGLADLTARYGIDYVVTEAGGPAPPGWPLAYQNRVFRIFRVPEHARGMRARR